MKQPLVSCIVVTYNSQEYIVSCIQALKKVTYPEIEIIVVDNHSTDQTLTLLKKNAARLNICARKTNDGYAGGHMFGIAKASGKYVFLLNPDTTVTPTFLEPLVKALEGKPDRAAAQPLVYLAAERQVINLTGKVTQYLGFDWIRDYKASKAPKSGEIMSVSGSGVLLNKSAVLNVGGLDESYFMYYEDTDLSWRLRLAGYHLYYCAESIIYHDYKFIPNEQYQSISQKLFWAERNRLATILKNYSWVSLLLLALPILVFELALLVYFTLKGWLPIKLKSYRALWQSRTTLVAARQQVQLLRKIDDHELTRPFQSKIEFDLFKHPLVNFVINPLLYLYWLVIWPLI